ncbi:hypothetical protein [Sinorhizobium meliloti]|nr:hypothetical protein [Sinorhizobium meliloti]
MAKDPNVQFMSFKSAAKKLLGDKGTRTRSSSLSKSWRPSREL